LLSYLMTNRTNLNSLDLPKSEAVSDHAWVILILQQFLESVNYIKGCLE
jgi:hypothetical protein